MSLIENTPKRKRNALRATAYHEAGHAIVSCVLSHRKPRKVSIIPEGDIAGFVRPPPWPHSIRPDIEIDLRTAQFIERQIIVSLAGPLAEKRYSGRYNAIGAGGDHDTAMELALRRYSDGATASYYLKWLSHLADRTLENESTQRAVEILAAKLLEHGQLSGKALRYALIEATLPPGISLEEELAFRQKMSAASQRRGK